MRSFRLPPHSPCPISGCVQATPGRGPFRHWERSSCKWRTARRQACAPVGPQSRTQPRDTVIRRAPGGGGHSGGRGATRPDSLAYPAGVFRASWQSEGGGRRPPPRAGTQSTPRRRVELLRFCAPWALALLCCVSFRVPPGELHEGLAAGCFVNAFAGSLRTLATSVLFPECRPLACIARVGLRLHCQCIIGSQRAALSRIGSHFAQGNIKR